MTDRPPLREQLLNAITHSGPGYEVTREPDDPAAFALAQHIADHRLSTIQNAFRYLGWNIQLVVKDKE
jgi:hypothetical protein